MKTLPRIACTLLLAASAVTTVGSVASAQGFFQSLFGGGSQPQEGRSAFESGWGRGDAYGGAQRAPAPGYGTLDPDDPRLQREMRRRASPRKHADGTAGSVGRQTAILATEDAPRGSIAYFAKDKTLRSGDVVVTDTGFLVVQSGGDHNGKSFVAINEAGGLKGEKKNLLALEEISAQRTPNTTIESITAVRDFIGPRTVEQLAIESQLSKPAVTASR